MLYIPIILMGMIIGRFLNICICKTSEKGNMKDSFQNPLVELTNGVLYGIVYYYFGLSITGIAYALLGSILLTIGIIDYYTMRIPNGLIILGIIIGTLYLITLSIHSREIRIMLNGIIGMVVGGGIIGGMMLFSLLVFRKEGMGVGDLKLLGMTGLFIGSRYVLYTIFIAVIVGGCYATIVFLKKGQEILPFGPFLSLGAVISILWGDALWHVYLYYMF